MKTVASLAAALIACHAGSAHAHDHNMGGFSPVDTANNGRGASCERGNGAFCGGGGSTTPENGPGNPMPPGRPGSGDVSVVNTNTNNVNNARNNNRNSNRNNNSNRNTNRNANTNRNTNNNRLVSTSSNRNVSTSNSSAVNNGNSSSTATSNSGPSTSNASARGGSATANSTGGKGGRGGKGGKAINKGNRQTVNVENTGNNYYRGDTPVAPLSLPAAPAGVGDVIVPLPSFGVSGFVTSIDDPWGSGSGDSTDAGFTFGIQIPMGGREFKEAALLRAKFKLAQEAKWLKDNGMLNKDQFPEHYALVHGQSEPSTN